MEWVEANSYRQWLEERVQARADAVVEKADNTLISIVMPVYNTRPDFLVEALDSIRAQSYENWELCVTNDASTLGETREILDEYALKDARISVHHSQQQGGIAVATNLALDRCRGKYVAFVDHDDCLTSDALVEVAGVISQHGNAGLIYSDSDLLDESGLSCNPYFKPEWNYLLFLGQNYLNHISVYRRDIIVSLGGLRTGLDGSQDYDLALRVIEQLSPEDIFHIPRVLYHWRRYSGSVARSNIQQAVKRARKAITDHLDRTGLNAVVQAATGKVIFNRIRPVLGEKNPSVLVVIWGASNANLTNSVSETIKNVGLLENINVNCINLTSQGSKVSDNDYSLMRGCSPAQLRNMATRDSKEDYIIFLHSCCEPIAQDWIQSLLSLLQLPGFTIIGARITTPEGRPSFFSANIECNDENKRLVLLKSFGDPDRPDYFGRSFLDQQVTACGGGVLAIKRTMFVALSGFNEKFTTELGADIDLCLRAQEGKGFSAVCADAVFRRHNEDGCSGIRWLKINDEERKRILEMKLLDDYADPQSNPNLDMSSGFPELTVI